MAHSSVLAQRYNPEFSSPMPVFISSTNTSALIDQLRHINKVSAWGRNLSLGLEWSGLSLSFSLRLNRTAIFICSPIQSLCDERRAVGLSSRKNSQCLNGKRRNVLEKISFFYSSRYVVKRKRSRICVYIYLKIVYLLYTTILKRQIFYCYFFSAIDYKISNIILHY